MNQDPIQYAKETAIKSIDEIGEIKAAIQDLTDSYKYELKKAKEENDKQMEYVCDLIIKYFSSDIQMDETPMGALKRNQIRKNLLEFAHSL